MPFVCWQCGRVWKVASQPDGPAGLPYPNGIPTKIPKCAKCSQPAEYIGSGFKAPARDDERAWKKAQELFQGKGVGNVGMNCRAPF